MSEHSVGDSGSHSDVSVTRSVVDLDGDRHLSVVSMTGDGSDSTVVRITDTLPDSHTLHLGRTEHSVENGGTLDVETAVGPDEVVRFGYVLAGSEEPTLADLTVELDTDLRTDGGIRAVWRGPDGQEAPLVVAPDRLLGSQGLELPVVSGPTSNGSRAAADSERAVSPLDGAAIGVVLTPTNGDAALRTVLRATRRGHTVFVTYSGRSADVESLDQLSSLGALVVEPPGTKTSQSALNRLLSEAARERGLPGIVLQTRDCPRIDYDRTAEAYERADYEVVAIPENWTTSSDSPTVVVGIPAYNAATSIGAVVERAAAFADEVVVVDDGSRDETAVRAREAGASVVIHEVNRGYGGALKTLFRTAADRDAEHLVVIDADGQHDPSDIPMLVETQTRDDADIVIGSRYVGERDTKIPFVRSIGLGLINGLTNASMGNLRPSGFVHDTQSGYRAYSRRAVRSLAADPMIGNNMGASTDILYHAHRARLGISEVPTTVYYDVENSSSQGSLSHGVDLLRNIVWTVEYGRPLLVVGMPGAISTVMGIAVTVLLLTTYLETGTVYAHQLLVSILFAVGGILLCIAAILMHVLNVHPTMKRLTTDANN
ncbi:glycosyltransferase family 2 protein [Haloarcula sp. S1CR25-12]|uniref:Glycosyltransferase family 2 protein n=1 Tax=Haloarcula saliterrae TaxID=2950534 RepID=A0ABU2FGM4_9EURY|nr:glycosyltransferase family 2 protein [Haloarcula sp. S1CR25-12]MDS0261394.1 glycosyltransferase family 2 protein [Haloarcula sp. S1CR25-12]